MKYDDNKSVTSQPTVRWDTQKMSTVRQLLEFRARLIDTKINNRLLHELVFKYSVLEKRFKALNKDGTLHLLRKGGGALGTFDLRSSDDPPAVLEEEHEQLCQGDKLIFYTDGVNEYQDAKGKLYGNDRFFDILKMLKDQPIENLIEAVFNSLIVFGNTTESKDDVSLLGLELKTS